MLISTPKSSKASWMERMYSSRTNMWLTRAEISSAVTPSGISVEDMPSTMKKTGVECISVQPSSFFAFCSDRWMSLSTSPLSTSREDPRAMVASHSSIRAKEAGTVSATSRMRSRLSCSVFCTHSTTALCRLCLSRNAPSRKPAYAQMPAPWTTIPSLSTMLPHRHTTLELPTSSIVAGFMLPPR